MTLINQLPNLIFAGAPKAGSSSICALLQQHPEVFMPDGNKEVFFFDFNYDKGLNWYAGHFPDASSYKVRVDATVWYMRWPNIPERILETLPAAKLLFVLRDPVSRAWSNYWHDYTTFSYSLSKPAEQILFDDGDPKGVLGSRLYHHHLTRWRSILPDCPTKVMFFEDFLCDPHSFWDELLEFCGLSTVPLPVAERKMAALGIRSKASLGLMKQLQNRWPRGFQRLSSVANHRPRVKNLIFSSSRQLAFSFNRILP